VSLSRPSYSYTIKLLESYFVLRRFGIIIEMEDGVKSIIDRGEGGDITGYCRKEGRALVMAQKMRVYTRMRRGCMKGQYAQISLTRKVGL